jgi:hypothetical protein
MRGDRRGGCEGTEGADARGQRTSIMPVWAVRARTHARARARAHTHAHAHARTHARTPGPARRAASCGMRPGWATAAAWAGRLPAARHFPRHFPRPFLQPSSQHMQAGFRQRRRRVRVGGGGGHEAPCARGRLGDTDRAQRARARAGAARAPRGAHPGPMQRARKPPCMGRPATGTWPATGTCTVGAARAQPAQHIHRRPSTCTVGTVGAVPTRRAQGGAMRGTHLQTDPSRPTANTKHGRYTCGFSVRARLRHALHAPANATYVVSQPDGAANDTELEKLKKRLHFVMYCTDCYVLCIVMHYVLY